MRSNIYYIHIQFFFVCVLLVIEPPNIVPPSENAVGTAVILDFLSLKRV